MVGVILFISKVYAVALTIVLLVYTIRHYIFSFNRIFGKQRISYGEIVDSDLPFVTVLIPMHNEEKVAKDILISLVLSTYPKDKLEITPIDDNSNDNTSKILKNFAEKYEYIKPLFRNSEKRGKPHSLNDALKLASGDIIVVFDADYLPGKGLIRELVINFIDPGVGAVMGRVVPLNISKNILTRLIDLERIGGYQVDQQARYNLKLIAQYGGTVGAFRKEPVILTGGFNENVLAEDTELTFRLYLMGYKVIYANRAECYEEVPEKWEVRAKQIRRWSCGHNQVMFQYITKIISSNKLSFLEKIDGILLLNVYLVPFLIFLGIINSIFLYFSSEYFYFIIQTLFSVSLLQSFGNFAPFFEIAVGAYLDGVSERVKLLPLLGINFFFEMWFSTLGFFDALRYVITKKELKWQKTERFRE
ncbi:glycosyltransferase [Caldisericum exile]|uniref:Glycosyltransferase n=1 Tax=Caldisericum exile (strain DSM 21853 / NBRC 104410 / AZM16c01) TaxID=511051 RepID=A0A7U6GDU8_CALEA|nr:glycosyltransferase [Caldisericum exile]BAL80487.1 putative glycosyltransferase [Caldisericum exile AZM16c01]